MAPRQLDPQERERVEELVAETVAARGVSVLELKLRPNRSISLTLDHESRAIDIEDCTRVNKGLRRAIEDAGLPADDYEIEVQSPGMDRPLLTLGHFERFLGERAQVRLKEEVEGRQTITGTISDVSDDQVTMEWDGEWEVSFTLDEIVSARLKPDYGKG